jgi:hypothetical protein
MSRRLPSAADVRAAVDAVRRSIRIAAAPVPASVRAVRWSVGGRGECPFCGESAPLVRPDPQPGAPLAFCEATLAELYAATRPPLPGEATDTVLAAVSAWAGSPEPGEPPAQLPPAEDPCVLCGREPDAVPDLAAGPDVSICSDCLAEGAAVIAPSIRETAVETEAHAAKLEIEDLQRMVAIEGPTLVRQNATLALSLLRLLSAPMDDGVRARLLALVRRIAGLPS